MKSSILVVLFLALVISCGLLVKIFITDKIRRPVINTSALSSRSAPPFPGAKEDNIFWFAQVSDLHFSIFYDPARVSQLKEFCSTHIDAIKPKLVLVTGDLTDAKHKDLQGSGQFQEEWTLYNDVLKETGVLKKTTWLDIRGNHDAFDVPSLTNQKNFYRTYSAQGKKHFHSYQHVEVLPFGKYIFNAVDACPNPGPRRPFNFFGMLTQDSLDTLEEFAQASEKSNATIWFGHYPTSLIGMPGPGLRHVMRNGIAYLCGHLHTLAGLVPKMHTLQKEGYLELELGDWKDNRMYRVVAMDHDLMSFTDVHFDTWPIILVTNPKDALYTLPDREPTGRMLKSTHIRLLVFSPGKILSVEVSIDTVQVGFAKQAKGPLYVLAWNPTDYSKGVHTIKVIAKDSLGNSTTVEQSFSLDHTVLDFGLMARLVLMLDLNTVGQTLYTVAMLTALLPLLYFRIMKERKTVNCLHLRRFFDVVNEILRRIYYVSVYNNTFYPLVIYIVYITIGPWFIGHVLDGHVGLCFLFGIYVNGTLIPSNLTYVYGFFQILMFVIPLILYTGWCIQHHLRNLKKDKAMDKPTCKNYIKDHWSFLLIVFLQVWFAYGGFFKAYGTMAFLLGPFRTWSAVLAIYLHRNALNVERQELEMKPEPSEQQCKHG
ncbi:transmembrane protein 62 [Lingula anatina]|uniref:Transmembrane protein 62 n=1 Tax=Lingula anatina TaxID=7574 RepID=A0A2R2MT35_LINAN|nr:transmembrane protein 62 [Lingula anatina]|eukprot:XP_023933430.1 transmembrane protein 62 [Lingula anatina]